MIGLIDSSGRVGKSRSPRGRAREGTPTEATEAPKVQPQEAKPDSGLRDKIKAAQKKKVRDRTEEETLLLASLGGKAGKKKWADVHDDEDDV